MKIPLKAELDARTVWAVAETAERLGISNTDVLEMRLSGLRHLSVPERVQELHARGFCDADIADEIGYLVAQVASIRRKLGLKPNRRFPGVQGGRVSGPSTVEGTK